MNRRRWLATVGLALAAAAGGYVLQAGLNPPSIVAPDVRFSDLEGKPHQLSEYRGQLVLINFWATWCAPCLNEIPMLVDVRNIYAARGFEILGPAMDRLDAVRDYRDRLKLAYPVFAGDAEAAAAMDALGDDQGALPYSVLVSPAGEILHRKRGEFSRDELVELIESHLI